MNAQPAPLATIQFRALYHYSRNACSAFSRACAEQGEDRYAYRTGNAVVGAAKVRHIIAQGMWVAALRNPDAYGGAL